MNIMVTSDFIRDYLADNFSQVGKFSSNGQEFIMPSPFLDNDWKCHFSINADSGLWQDFKTGNTGGFIKLYSVVEEISYKKAEAELTFKNFFYEDKQRPVEEPVTTDAIDFDSNTLKPVTLESCDSDNPLEIEAWKLLFGRNLFNLEEDKNEFYFCESGKYGGRVIIPFIKNDKMYYFQARSLKESLQPKYLNPPAEQGVRPSTILYPFKDGDEEPYVVICEGPIDALSLQLQGVNATCTMGCKISHIQMDILKEFKGKIYIGYDNDDAGARGLEKADHLRKMKLMQPLHVIHPPEEYKDWNEAHMKGYNLKPYIEQNSKKYDFNYRIDQKLTSI